MSGARKRRKTILDVQGTTRTQAVSKTTCNTCNPWLRSTWKKKAVLSQHFGVSFSGAPGAIAPYQRLMLLFISMFFYRAPVVDFSCKVMSSSLTIALHLRTTTRCFPSEDGLKSAFGPCYL